MNISEAAIKVACSVAAACIVGGGTMVLKTAADTASNTKQLERLEARQESLDATLKTLSDNVHSLDKNVAVLNERMERMNESRY